MKPHETIEELLNAPEGENYQFKEWKKKGDFDKAVKICCALANCGGGKLVLGVTDKRPRKIVGSLAFPQPERTRVNLMNKLGIRVDFDIYQHENGRVLAFDVASRPVGLPVQAPDGAWWYNGDEFELMPENVRRKIYAESGHDFSADICKNATIKDLDLDSIETFRNIWVRKRNNNRIRNLSPEQLLMDCGAITDKGVTYAALILFGTNSALREYLPQSEIIFEYRSSNATGPAQQREEFRIGFFAYYNRIWELINLRNDLQHYLDGFTRLEIPTFNEDIVREVLLNAASHRNYQYAGSIFVRQYRDRLIVESPGGFPLGVTVDNILYKQTPRNRRIAEILALCGLIERSGQGIDLIYELSVRDAKPLPSFVGTDDYHVCITLNGLIIDKKMPLLINEIMKFNIAPLTTEDFIIINTLYLGKRLSEMLLPYVESLIDSGIVERAGRGKFVLSEWLYDAIGESNTYTRRKGLERDAAKAIVLMYIRRNADAGTSLNELLNALPDQTRGQIQVFLRELRDEGLINLQGKTKAAKWFLNSD